MKRSETEGRDGQTERNGESEEPVYKTNITHQQEPPLSPEAPGVRGYRFGLGDDYTGTSRKINYAQRHMEEKRAGKGQEETGRNGRE